ncbi:MAG: SDR family oxidoreductase [Dehalococcoidia bacterium]|jgi:gluconate 5-dehydrogenase|nr:SDR family oxidoreductase [Dehalococcoidia bacterium]MDP7262306.1 SDR family oxidoreductase [Dehalococcoidia bacterium]MDP7484459.1 SDR family oxidoreductase [Dehalococcoidia bacterium]|tara:strand:+ start:3211 stop:4002 length:792 start_codon:yes stop_codon:yes gene_type:complete
MTKTVQELFDLTGRTAIVTGGGTHLGTAFTEALCDLGAKVYIASRRAELCQEVAQRLRGRGMDVLAMRCDVTEESQVDALVDRVMNENGRLDIAVCNAGGSFTTGYPPDADIDEFRRTLEANLTGTYITAQSAGRAMIPAKNGSIITLGSIASTLSMDPRIYNSEFKRSGPPYIAAKGGVLNLTRAMAAEFGEYGITVNCISPGQIPRTETNADQVETFRKMIPLQRTGVSQDLKGTVALLASDAGTWITGQEFRVDGGWSIW